MPVPPSKKNTIIQYDNHLGRAGDEQIRSNESDKIKDTDATSHLQESRNKLRHGYPTNTPTNTPIKTRSLTTMLEPGNIHPDIRNAHDMMAQQSSAFSCAHYLGQGGAIPECFKVLYQQYPNQPAVEVDFNSNNINQNILASYNNQLAMIQQYNNEILYSILVGIEAQKQQIINILSLSNLQPAPNLMQVIMPPVVWPQPVYLPDLMNSRAQMPHLFQQDTGGGILQYQPMTTAVPIYTRQVEQNSQFVNPGFYIVPTSLEPMVWLNNPCYVPWNKRMQNSFPEMEKSQHIDAEEFYTYAREPLNVQDIFNSGKQNWEVIDSPEVAHSNAMVSAWLNDPRNNHDGANSALIDGSISDVLGMPYSVEEELSSEKGVKSSIKTPKENSKALLKVLANNLAEIKIKINSGLSDCKREISDIENNIKSIELKVNEFNASLGLGVSYSQGDASAIPAIDQAVDGMEQSLSDLARQGVCKLSELSSTMESLEEKYVEIGGYKDPFLQGEMDSILLAYADIEKTYKQVGVLKSKLEMIYAHKKDVIWQKTEKYDPEEEVVVKGKDNLQEDIINKEAVKKMSSTLHSPSLDYSSNSDTNSDTGSDTSSDTSSDSSSILKSSSSLASIKEYEESTLDTSKNGNAHSKGFESKATLKLLNLEAEKLKSSSNSSAAKVSQWLENVDKEGGTGGTGGTGLVEEVGELEYGDDDEKSVSSDGSSLSSVATVIEASAAKGSNKSGMNITEETLVNGLEEKLLEKKAGMSVNERPIVSPAPPFNSWVAVSGGCENDVRKNGEGIILDRDGYYVNHLPDVKPVISNDKSAGEKLAYHLNVNVNVNITTNVDQQTFSEIETNFSSVARNISEEIDVVKSKFQEKPKDWTSFIESDKIIIDGFKSQIDGAKIRRDNGGFDALFDYWRSGTLNCAPDVKKYNVIVSKEAAEKYHDTFFPGTSVDSYRLGQLNYITHIGDRYAGGAVLSVAASENMSFDNVYKGFSIILDENKDTPRKVYICYKDDYCHQNSTELGETKLVPFTENIPGLIPEPHVSLKYGEDSVEFYLGGEREYSFLYPPTDLPESLKSCFKSYNSSMAELWQPQSSDRLKEMRLEVATKIQEHIAICKEKRPDMSSDDVLSKAKLEYGDAISTEFLMGKIENNDRRIYNAFIKSYGTSNDAHFYINDMSWNYQERGVHELANNELCILTDFKKKYSSQMQKNILVSTNINFKTYESILYSEHDNVKEMAKKTTELVMRLVDEGYSDIKEQIASLLSKEALEQNFKWADSNGDEQNIYCKTLNDAGSKSYAYIIYNNGRRILDLLTTGVLKSELKPSIKEHLKLLASMDSCKTEIHTDDYEAFYINPAGNPYETKKANADDNEKMDALPIIRDNLARGGLVLKPFKHPNKTGLRSGNSGLGEYGYMEKTKDGSTKGYASYDYITIPVARKDDESKWLLMNYSYKTDSIMPLTESEYDIMYLDTKWHDYAKSAEQFKSRALVKNTDYCNRPDVVMTSAGNDLYGIHGLNVMSWDAMKHCSPKTDAERTKWKSVLEEETCLINKYKDLLPRERALVFELTMSLSNAKKQSYTPPQKIKNSLSSAIFLVKVALEASNNNMDRAASTILQVRHMMHENMPGARMTEKQEYSFESRRDILVNYVKAHKNHCEGIQILCQKQIDDPACMFLQDGSLEADTKILTEEPNTFVSEQMLLKKHGNPFHVAYTRQRVDAKGGRSMDYDSGITRSKKSAQKIVPCIQKYRERKDSDKDYVRNKLTEISSASKFDDMGHAIPKDLFLPEMGDKKIEEDVVREYLDSSKVRKILNIDRPDYQFHMDDLWKFDFAAMKTNSERILLDECKSDAEKLKGILSSDVEIENYRGSNGSKSIPTQGLEMPFITLCSNDYREYVAVDNADKITALEMSTSELTGAINLLGAHRPNDVVDTVALTSAKAAALQILSTSTYRPDAHICIDGINCMTNGHNFTGLSGETQLDALRYTTAGLNQKGAQVNCKNDFNIWEILVTGKKGSAESRAITDRKKRAIDQKYEELMSINQKVNEIENFIDEHDEIEYNEADQNTLDQYIAVLNKMFSGVVFTRENISDFFGGDGNIAGKEMIMHDGLCLYSKEEKVGKIFAGKGFVSESEELGCLKGISGFHGLGYRIQAYTDELRRVQKAYTKYDNEKHDAYPAEKVMSIYMKKLGRLKEDGFYLPLQDLNEAATIISCDNEEKCIQLVRDGSLEALESFINSTIDTIVTKRKATLNVKNNLRNIFAKQLSAKDIVESFKSMSPIKNKEEVDAIKYKIKKLRSKEFTSSTSSDISKHENKLKELRSANGIIVDEDEIVRQVDLLDSYTKYFIDQGPDSIALEYDKLLNESNGSIDDKIKALAIIHVAFALINNMSTPKPSQAAALLAAINSKGKSLAICAEPGSGKSVYIYQAVTLARRIGDKNKQLPIFVTNNDTLLQQDYENFRPWGKIFHLPVIMLKNNFEDNIESYSRDGAMLFGTAETVMGDKTRLNTLDITSRLIDKDLQLKPAGKCSNDQVIELYTNGFNRGIVFDEFDTSKDKDCSGALIISEQSLNVADNWKVESYAAFFDVVGKLHGKDGVGWNDYKQEMINELENKKRSQDNPQDNPQANNNIEIELGKLQSMTQADWELCIKNISKFIQRKDQYQLQKTYTIGYEVNNPDNASDKVVVVIEDPSQNKIQEHKKQGHELKIYPINRTTAEIVKNSSFTENASNFLAYMHGLPLTMPTRTVASTAVNTFFNEEFKANGMITLTATYGDKEMQHDLVPMGTTNIYYESPYKLNVTEHTTQVFDEQSHLYDNVVNMANYYIDQKKDVIILCSEQADVFSIDKAFGLYAGKVQDFSEKASVVTLANLTETPDYKVFENRVGSLNTSFGKDADTRKKGYIINATDACSRGFNFDAKDAVLISVGIPPSARAKLQKNRRVGRKGNAGIVHNLVLKRELSSDVDTSSGNSSDEHGSIYSNEIQQAVSRELEGKDHAIHQKALMRNSVQEVVARFSNVFTIYHQQLKVFERINCNDLPFTDKLGEVHSAIQSVPAGTADEILEKWYAWRDGFIKDVEGVASTPEDLDKIIRNALIENGAWKKFISTLPCYDIIIGSDFSEPDVVSQKDLERLRHDSNSACLLKNMDADKLREKFLRAQMIIFENMFNGKRDKVKSELDSFLSDLAK
ncbi:MAG: hypothetical protein QS721_04895 [Candidatus Endonucleobacter sp. (ex Gigantidas childressi)]|nr:hypothetical protein [Candidatus Endonucleobacter sp. (ex Gigantidas childressi)]